MEGPTPAWAERGKSPLSNTREKVAVTTLNQSRLNRLLAQAIAAYTQGKWTEALNVSNQIYQIDACWLDNILLLGSAHFQLRNFSEAIFYSQQAIRVDPQFAEAYSNLGNSLKELGDLDAAVQAYDKAIKLKPRFCDPYNNLGSTYAQLGRAEDAIETYKMALMLNPALADAHSNLGNLYKAQGKLSQAKRSYLEAVRIKPDFAIAWSNLGGVFKSQKDYKSAVSYYEEAIRVDPEFSDAHNNLGAVLHEMNKIEEAKTSFQTAIRIRPDFAIAHGNLANCLFTEGNIGEAIRVYKYAIQLEPNYPDAYNNLGNALKENKQLDKAIDCYRTALKLKLDHPPAYNNLGTALKEKGMVKEAIHCYTTACRLMPNYAEAQNNLASLLKEQGKLQQAIAHYQEAIAIDPEFAEAYSNMGNVYKELGEVEEAIKCFTAAVKILPSFAHAYCNLAGAFKDTKRYEDAITCYRKALSLKPDFTLAFANLCFVRACICNWNEREKDHAKLMSVLDEELKDENVLPSVQPYFAMAFDLSLERAQQISQRYAQAVLRSVRLMSVPVTRRFKSKKSHERLRIGYVAGKFGNHPITHAMASVFKMHDSLKFEVFCYALSPDDESVWRRKVEEEAEHFKDISELTYFDAARLIRTDNIHVLINLDGYTKGACNQIFARRPAPIQASYMGFAGTMGAEFMDYVIADQVTIPLKHAQFYDEKIVHLPNSHVICDHNQSARSVLNVHSEGPTRTDFDIPETKTVFCCFSQHHKIDPAIFKVWMNILKQVPDSLLWLLEFPAESKPYLLKTAEECGIKSPEQKLYFSELLPKGKHLERCYLADIFLDTPVINAFTTAADMLWSGTPIITIAGQRAASRTCASMLTSVGLGELVCKDYKEYEEKAVSLGCARSKLWALRKKLEQLRLTSPLFNTTKSVHNLEKAYLNMWHKHEWGHDPDHITIT